MSRSLLVFAILMLLGVGGPAARAVEYERILLPILIKPFPGAFGTQWRVDTQMLIDSEERLDIFPLVNCVLCIERFPRRSSFEPPLFLQQPDHPPGAVLHVQREYADLVRLSLRLRELTRGSAAGVELPVVRERNFFTRTIHILDVPLRLNSRTTLRVYDVDTRPGTAVRIRFFEPQSTTPLLTLDTAFTLPPTYNPNLSLNVTPGYIQLNGLEEIYPVLRNIDRIRVEIQPLSTDLRMWAFISITDDVTQQVTLLTPQ